MMRSILVGIFLLISLNSFSQSADSLTIHNKLNQLERENIEMKAKLEAYNDNNSNILNTVSITIAILLGIFGIVNISQLIQNHRLNNKKLADIESKIRSDLKREVNEKVESQVNSKITRQFSEVKEIKDRLAGLEISTIENKCPSLNTHNIDLEIMNLVRLIDLSHRYYKESGFEYNVNNALDGLIKHLEKHRIHEYEKESIFKALKTIDSNFDFKVSKLQDLLNNK